MCRRQNDFKPVLRRPIETTVTSGLLPIEFISLNRSFPDGALPLVANPESIRDDAAQVTGAPEMAEAGDDDSEAA